MSLIGSNEENRVCPKCGKLLPKDSIFCQYCGADLELTDNEFTAIEEALNGLKVYGHRGLGGF